MPDLVIEPLVLERGYMIEGARLTHFRKFGMRCELENSIFGYSRKFVIQYQENDNTFLL